MLVKFRVKSLEFYYVVFLNFIFKNWALDVIYRIEICVGFFRNLVLYRV